MLQTKNCEDLINETPPRRFLTHNILYTDAGTARLYELYIPTVVLVSKCKQPGADSVFASVWPLLSIYLQQPVLELIAARPRAPLNTPQSILRGLSAAAPTAMATASWTGGELDGTVFALPPDMQLYNRRTICSASC